MAYLLSFIILCLGGIVSAQGGPCVDTQKIKHNQVVKIIDLPATLRLEGDALFERITKQLLVDSKLISSLKVDSIRDELLKDISYRSDSPILTAFLDHSPSKESLEHHFYLHLEGDNKVVEDFYFFYILNTASLYQMQAINEVTLPNKKRINWREVYLRKILSLEKNGYFYGKQKKNIIFTTLCVWDTLKIILKK